MTERLRVQCVGSSLSSHVVGAVEVLDDDFSVVTRTGMTGSDTYVEVPAPGRYHVRGWTDYGWSDQRSVTVPAGSPATVRFFVWDGHADAPSSDAEPYASFRLDDPVGSPVTAGTVIEGHAFTGSRPVALIGVRAAGGWTVVTHVPEGVPVAIHRTDGLGAAFWSPQLRDGTARVLLSFLHQGDLIGAEAVTQWLLAHGSEPTASSEGVGIGYHLVRHDDSRAAGWVAALGEVAPESVDVLLLRCVLAWQQGRVPDAGESEVYRRAIAGDLPVLAAGMPLLDRCLAWNDRFRGDVVVPAEIRARVADRLAAACPSLLTSYTADPEGRVRPAPHPVGRPVGHPVGHITYLRVAPAPESSELSLWRLSRLNRPLQMLGGSRGVEETTGTVASHLAEEDGWRARQTLYSDGGLRIRVIPPADPNRDTALVRLWIGEVDYLVPASSAEVALTARDPGDSVVVDRRLLDVRRLSAADAPAVRRGSRVVPFYDPILWNGLARHLGENHPVRIAVEDAINDDGR